MICISFSERFAHYIQIIPGEETLSFEVANRVSLPVIFDLAQLNNPDFENVLSKVFSEVKDKIPVPDRDVAVSVPSSMVNLVVDKVDVGLPPDETIKVLQWNSEKRLGEVIDKKFIQHYPLSTSEDSVMKNILTISYFKDLLRILANAAQPSGFNINLIDINIFSACKAVEKIREVSDTEKWGVWLVGSEIQKLLIVDSGEFRQFIEFKFNDNSQFEIINNSSPDVLGLDVTKELDAIRSFSQSRINSLDKMFYYSHETDSEFFNMLMTYGIDNLKIVDPFEKHKPLEVYKGDGEGVGAMCQFLDVIGLAMRTILENE